MDAMPEQPPCHVKHIDNWGELLTFLSSPTFDGPWLFRGERECDWTFRTSLERAVPVDFERAVAELTILQHFRERVHTYLAAPLIPETDLEWLALIQHHGGPTRLIDWTESCWVGLFFACEHAPERGDSVALWAVNHIWLWSRAMDSIEKALNLSRGQAMEKWILAQGISPFANSPGMSKQQRVSDLAFRDLLIANECRMLLPVRPPRLSERMTIQQGRFLCQGDVGASVLDNWPSSSEGSSENLWKIEIAKHLRSKAIQHLRSHNISRATLFPGIDGFTQSLTHLWLREAEDERDARIVLDGIERATGKGQS